ncbi:MAG TPA: ABC transporter permease, partial [Gemmatimonadaceae bacterium]
TRGARRDALDEEIALHIDLRIEQLVARGMTREEATAEAIRRFGGSIEGFNSARHTLHRSAERREGRMRFDEQLDAVRKDVRYAWRAMWRAPGFSITAILTLALGIGANTAMFGVVNAALLRPLPYAQSDRLVMVWNHWTNWPQTWLSSPEAADYGEQREIFASLSPFSQSAANLTGNGDPERVRASFIPAGMLATLGARPIAGRDFTVQEDQPGGPNAVLLDHGLWQRRFAADRAIIGRSIEVNGISRTVVGILPPDFRLPVEFAGERSQIYMPIQLGPSQQNQRGSHYLLAVARLAPNVSIAQANARLAAFVERMKKDNPNQYGPEFGATLVPVTDQVFGGSRNVLLLLLGAVAFVLLIGCANVANLLLSRAESRQREIAIRAALGAGRQRLARQLLTESLLLGLVGGAVALPLAILGGPMLIGMGAANLPRADAASFDASVLLFTFAMAIVTSLIFGVAPVMHALRGDLHGSLRASRGALGGQGGLELRQLIITVQVALAVVSVAGATVMLKSFRALLAVPPGFNAERVLTMRVSVPAARYRGISPVQSFYTDLVARARALPGVTAAGAINRLPLTGVLGDWSLDIQGRAPKPGEQTPAFDWQVATPGYFDAMGIQVRRGRAFTTADSRGAAPVVIISDATARKFWPDADPIGAHIKLGGSADSVWREVIGVVADVRHQALDKEIRPEMYLPHAQFPATVPDSVSAAQNGMSLVLRTSADPTAVTSAARALIRSVDPLLPLSEVRTLSDLLTTSVATPRLATFLLGIFGALALVLSAIGVYGVMSYSVARRTNEIGIRLALGARAVDVTRLVVRQGMRPAVVGLVLGVAAALSGSKLMEGLLYGVSATDKASLATAVLVLGGTALVATMLPARRVSKVDPVSSLRSD